jgi:hypothetical protein
MTKFDWIILLLTATLITILLGFAFIADKRREEREDRELKEAERNRFSEDVVWKEQLEFEKRSDENVVLPDGIRGQKAYIYRHLMSRWYDELIAKHRFNELMAHNIRRDWVIYMDLLDREERLSYLSVESSIEDKRAACGLIVQDEKKLLLRGLNIFLSRSDLTRHA